MNIKFLLCFSILFCNALTASAQYIDPGSGSYIMQILLGGVLAFIFYYKLIIFKLKSAILFIVKRIKGDKHAQ